MISLYVRAMGPVYLGVPWLPVVFAGVFLLLLLLAIPTRNSPVEDRVAQDAADEQHDRRHGPVFWILLGLFVVAILIGMFNPQIAM
jgi:hypothetical protein